MKTPSTRFTCLAFFLTWVAVIVPGGPALGAVDRVICVPWQGDPLKYHTALDNQSVRLQGVIRTDDLSPIWYQWIFGDGTQSAVAQLTGAMSYNVEADHVYRGAVRTPFTARLLVDSVDESMSHAIPDPYLIKLEEPGLDARVNIAIDNGLWFLHKNQYVDANLHTFNGKPFAAWRQTSYEYTFASPTASAIQAYQINGHKETGNPDEDPYVTDVRDGFNWLFSGYYSSGNNPMLRSLPIDLQHGDNPDTDGNGQGIEVRDYGYRPIYQGGMVMDAIISSGTPDADSGRDFDGDGINETYREVLQDMADMFAWGQEDSGFFIGGWRYSWNSQSDNSAAQWAAIGLIPAQGAPWNCIVPAWVKTLNNQWLTNSHQSLAGDTQGGFGYTGSGWGDATTPGGMVQLAFVGAGRGEIRWDRCERWFAENWKGTGRNWLDQENIYGYYGFAKAMRVALPAPITAFAFNGFDWYRGSPQTMGLAEKVSTRLIDSHSWSRGPWVDANLATAWSVIILRPVLFQEAPIACFNAEPNPTYPDTAVDFDPQCSGHSDPSKSIANLILFEWDWDNDGVYDEATSLPETVNHSFACATIPCAYPVTLRVTDDIGNTATYRQEVRITNPPHPPVSRLKGPYWLSLCDLDELRLDGSDSFDPDQGTHEAGCPACPEDTITAWDWDLNGAPWTYPGPAGAIVQLGSDWHSYFPAAGTYDIGLKVTDNTAAAYPGSGQPNLTHEAFTRVHLFEEGPCDVVLSASCRQAELSWESTGADRYAVLMSAESANTGFNNVAETVTTNVVLTDLPLGVRRWVRIAGIHSDHSTLSRAVELRAEPDECRPIANPGGPYDGCVGRAVTLSGAASVARLGTIVAWAWDLDDDGTFDDASGVRVTHTWDAPGTYRIGLRVASSGGGVMLMDTAQTTVTIVVCQCLDDLAARPKLDKIQLTWSHDADAESYNVYRSSSPWFEPDADHRIAAGLQTTYATYLDSNLPLGATYFYRVAKVIGGQEVCLSDEVPGTTLPRRGNAPPVANAGPDQVVTIGAEVRLDGTRSFDPNGTPVSYRWQLTRRPGGSQAVLTGDRTATPAFTVDVKGVYVGELTVNDGAVDSAPDTVTIRTENAPPQANPGENQQVQVGAVVELDGSKSTDPDGDPLTFRWLLNRRPDASNARVDDPSAEKTSITVDAAGVYEVALIVSDGISDSAPAALTITTINSPPVARAGADRTVAVGTAVDLDGSASSDVDGDPITFVWTLTARPGGSSAVLTAPGSPQTSLTPDQPGRYTVELVVSDGRLNSAPDTVVINANAGPTADAGDDLTTRVGVAVELDGSASSDPEDDPLTYAWTLVQAPPDSKATLDDATLAKPAFTPDRKGEYTFELKVSDGQTTSAADSVVVTVGNSAPVADAGADLEVDVGQLVALTGTGSSDVDGDPLTYSWTIFLQPPGGNASLDNATSPTPRFTANVPGEYRLELVVNDGQASSEADSVTVRTRNRPPIAEAGPGQVHFVGDTFFLSGTISSDPDGDPLAFEWSMVSAPSGSTAELDQPASPTPTFVADVEGEYRVRLVVNDGQLPSAPDDVVLVAKPFRTVPEVVGMAEADAGHAIVGAGLVLGTVTRRSDATVPAGIVLAQTPVGGSRADPGSAVDVVVSSGPDTQDPVVTVAANPSFAPVGATVTLTVTVTDDGAIANVVLTVNDVPVALTGNQATFVCPAVGSYVAKATATDAAGNVGEGQTTFYAVDPNDTTPPVVAITAPADNAGVTTLTDVTGSAYDPDGQFAYYTVEMAPADLVDLSTLESSAFVEIGRGTAEVHDGKLASFDPTLLQNDAYVIRVTGWDLNGQGNRQAVVVNVTGDLKLGNFRLEFTDLTVPLAGIPIVITRIYDTLDALRSGDFGYGWRLGIRDARIFETLRPSGVGPTMYPGCRVFINTPDGRRVGFTAYTRSNGGFLFPWIVEVAFRPDPGVYERLEFAGYTEGALNGLLLSGMYFTGLGESPFDPNDYRLFLKDGTIYDYSQTNGLQRITDRSGNHTDFADDGILHFPSGGASPDESIDFVRDAAGRITHIVDPNGNALAYAYDARGDLVSFTDQVSNVTQYSYRNDRLHYLDRLIDPLGRPAIRTEYDDQGRIVAIIDALGHRIEQGFDLGQNVSSTTDANGHLTLQYFDERGNVTKTVDPEGGVTEFQYDANNNETWRKDPRGNITEREYDAQGNVTLITDAAGNIATVAYDAGNSPTLVTDALGHTTTFAYDADGLLSEIVNDVGARMTFTRDDQGRVTSVTDFNGHTTTHTYDNGCACGKPSRITQPDGTSRLYEYNSFGDKTQETDEFGRTTVWQYDAAGRLLSMTDAEGQTTTNEYSASLLIRRTDQLGRATQYAYDNADRLTSLTDAKGGVTTFQYDNGTNRTAVTDAAGNVTRFAYDGANRLVKLIDAAGKTNTFAYDAAGNRTESVDRNGRRRTYAYDAMNRRTEESWWDGATLVRTLTFEFNSVGVMTAASDPTSSLSFEYDTLSRLTRSTQTGIPNLPDFTLDYTYDALENAVSVTDNWGVQVTSEFDPRNRLIGRVWQGGGLPGSSLRFSYDASGNRTNVARFADTAGTQPAAQTAYRYNALGAITRIVHADPDDGVRADYDYQRDAAQQIIRRMLDGQTVEYAYDLIGQLTGAAYSDQQTDENYSYDAGGNRIGGGIAIGAANQITADADFTYQYDGEGNLSRKTRLAGGAVTIYAYDHRDRLIRAEDQDAGGNPTQVVEFVYDALNRRVAKTSGAVSERFLYNHEDIWADADVTGAVTARYLLGNRMDELLARYQPARGVEWHLTDNLGTVRDIADGAGKIAVHIDYDSFGNVVGINNPAVADRFLFTGREFDPETGFYYCRARYYSPQLGRFVSQDPIGFDAGDYNLYRYVSNSPLNHTDPTGLFSIGEYALKVWNAIKALAPTKAVAAKIRCVFEVIACVLGAIVAFQKGVPVAGWLVIAACLIRAALCPFTL